MVVMRTLTGRAPSTIAGLVLIVTLAGCAAGRQAPPPPRTLPAPPLANLPSPGAPPPPAIDSMIRVLGIMQGESGARVASLSDGTAAPPILAVEGDVVLGRYRVLRVSPDAVEMDYADGSGARARIPLPPPTR